MAAKIRNIDPLSLETYFARVLKTVSPNSRITTAADEVLQQLIREKIQKLTLDGVAVARNRDKGKKAPKTQKEDRQGTLLARDLATVVEIAFSSEFAPTAIDTGYAAIAAVEAGSKGQKQKNVRIKKGDNAGKTRASPTRREDLAGTVVPVSRVENIMREVTDEVETIDPEGATVQGIRVDADALLFMTAVIDYVLRELLSVAFDIAQENDLKTVENVFVGQAIARDPNLAQLFGPWALTNLQQFEKRERAPRKPSAGKKGGKKATKAKKSASPRSRAQGNKKGGKARVGSPRSAGSDDEGSQGGRGGRDESAAQEA